MITIYRNNKTYSSVLWKKKMFEGSPSIHTVFKLVNLLLYLTQFSAVIEAWYINKLWWHDSHSDKWKKQKNKHVCDTSVVARHHIALESIKSEVSKVKWASTNQGEVKSIVQRKGLFLSPREMLKTCYRKRKNLTTSSSSTIATKPQSKTSQGWLLAQKIGDE